MLSIVQRAFHGGETGELLAVGQLVDSSGWRLERQLRDQHFLRPATEPEIAEFKKKTSSKAEKAAEDPQANAAKTGDASTEAPKKTRTVAPRTAAARKSAAKKPAAGARKAAAPRARA
jgi:hypothetical protein